jgi:hypothetical protein
LFMVELSLGFGKSKWTSITDPDVDTRGAV